MYHKIIFISHFVIYVIVEKQDNYLNIKRLHHFPKKELGVASFVSFGLL